MSVSYNGQKLIPVQSVTISPEQNLTGDGQVIGVVFNLTINGTILSYKGSPNSSGVFDTGPISTYPADESPTLDQNFEFLIRKQEYIRKLFATEGKSLEFQPLTGASPIKCNPRNIKIEFPGDKWFNKCNYIITCQADVLYGNTSVGLNEYSFNQYVSEINETWNFEENFDEPQHVGLNQNTFRVGHVVSAKGKRFYDETGTVHDAWKEARNYVKPRLGFDNAFLQSSGIVEGISWLRPYNHVSVESIGVNDGTYSVSETFLLASGTLANLAVLEEFDVSKRFGTDNGLTSVAINGTIRGLEYEVSGINTITRYQNANDYFNSVSGIMYTRATQFSNVSNLNVRPLNQTIGINPTIGVINFSYEYDTRMSHFFNDSLMENISVTDNFDIDAFASIFILGRGRLGPLMQDLGTKKEFTRGLNIECVFPTQSGLAGLLNNPRMNSNQSGILYDIINYVRPGGQSFISQQNSNFEAKTGRYSQNIEWQYQP